MTDVDLARLAAYIDGEGCISITKPCLDAKNGRKYHKLVIDISNSDPRLMNWLKENFGGHVCFSRNMSSPLAKKICMSWRVHSKVAEDLLRFCMPYFVMKGKQAELALQFRDSVTRKNGRRGMNDGVFAEREAFRQTLSKMKREVGQFMTVKE